MGKKKPAKKKRQTRPRATNPNPAPIAQPMDDEDDEYANAA